MLYWLFFCFHSILQKSPFSLHWDNLLFPSSISFGINFLLKDVLHILFSRDMISEFIFFKDLLHEVTKIKLKQKTMFPSSNYSLYLITVYHASDIRFINLLRSSPQSLVIPFPFFLIFYALENSLLEFYRIFVLGEFNVKNIKSHKN